MTKTPIQLRSAAACKTVLKNLERRGFEAFYCEDKKAALAKVLELIPAGDVVSWGGSVTLQEIGLMDEMRSGRYKVIDRDTAATPEQRTDLLRQALLCDTFLMSSNARQRRRTVGQYRRYWQPCRSYGLWTEERYSCSGRQ